MANLTLTIALERYDRHMPFFDGTVKPPAGITLKALQVGQSNVLRDGIGRRYGARLERHHHGVDLIGHCA